MCYGGRRYYFLCPKHGRCEVLPMVAGVISADQIDRMRDRAHKLEKRLWPDKGKPRPRGRNGERLVEAWSEADSAFENNSPRPSCAAGAICFRGVASLSLVRQPVPIPISSGLS